MILRAILCLAFAPALPQEPKGGALDGERFRVVVSSDIGGSDPDDFQSMVHYLVYADVFDTEGLVSSPPGKGRKEHILEALSAYEKDYGRLKARSPRFPPSEELRAVTRQGAVDAAPEQGFSASTEGSSWIVQRARDGDARPLYVLVWGSITDVAQAVHDDPSIKKKIRVHSIGSWNTRQDPHARRYLHERHPDLWWVESDVTFRGMYQGGRQEGDLGNRGFVEEHVRGHGALGDLFYAKKRDIKMGDTPSVLYLMRGDPADPVSDHWGGRFRAEPGCSTHWIDQEENPRDTVNRWREAYLRDWQKRMKWLKGESSP